jgi:hypothetical protein
MEQFSATQRLQRTIRNVSYSEELLIVGSAQFLRWISLPSAYSATLREISYSIWETALNFLLRNSRNVLSKERPVSSAVWGFKMKSRIPC